MFYFGGEFARDLCNDLHILPLLLLAIAPQLRLGLRTTICSNFPRKLSMLRQRWASSNFSGLIALVLFKVVSFMEFVRKVFLPPCKNPSETQNFQCLRGRRNTSTPALASWQRATPPNSLPTCSFRGEGIRAGPASSPDKPQKDLLLFPILLPIPFQASKALGFLSPRRFPFVLLLLVFWTTNQLCSMTGIWGSRDQGLKNWHTPPITTFCLGQLSVNPLFLDLGVVGDVSGIFSNRGRFKNEAHNSACVS